MRLVNFSEIYQLREENRTTDISAIGYIYGWCANFFYPLVFCLGLIRKNKKMLLIGGLSFLFLFSIMGQKSHDCIIKRNSILVFNDMVCKCFI